MNLPIPRALVTGTIAVLAAVNLSTQFDYLSQASDPAWVTAIDRLVELRRATSHASVMLDVPDLGKAQLAALYARGRPLATYSSERCLYFLAATRNTFSPPPWVSSHYGDMERLVKRVVNSYRRLQFPLGLDGPEHHDFWRLDFTGNPSMVDAALVSSTPAESVLNNSAERPTTGRYYVRALASVANYLVQVDSSLGCTIVPGIVDPVALWQREPDFANPGGVIQAMGRHLLFEVVNPVGKARLLLDFTNTPLAGQGLALPSAAAIGDQRVGLGFVGRGAARVVSAAITPRDIGGRGYIAIDMGMAAVKLQHSRRGLAGLYNRHLGFDPRSLVGFARNISLITQEQADGMLPPMSVERFPIDLFQPGLLFSGIYEDGWMAEVARFRLGSASPVQAIRIKGHVPHLNQRVVDTMIEIAIDGQQIARHRLQSGDFDLQLPIPASVGRHWIELRAEPTERLPAPDLRIASLLLKSIALQAVH
jgi:hypothetical protein